MNDNRQVITEALSWLEGGHSVVLATVVSTWDPLHDQEVRAWSWMKTDALSDQYREAV